MLVNTESNILMFQFENIKWRYSPELAKQKKNKDKEEEREENSLTEDLSKASIQVYNMGDSMSTKQVVAQETLLSKPHKPRVLLRAARLPTGKKADPHAISGVPRADGRLPVLVSLEDILASGFLMI